MSDVCRRDEGVSVWSGNIRLPPSQEFSKNCAALLDHALEFGFVSTFQQLIESLDPLGETHALRVSGIVTEKKKKSCDPTNNAPPFQLSFSTKSTTPVFSEHNLAQILLTCKVWHMSFFHFCIPPLSVG